MVTKIKLSSKTVKNTPLATDYIVLLDVEANSANPPIKKALFGDIPSSVPRLDDCLAPEDNTDLNASITAHGLLPKLSNTATEFLNGQGGWSNVDSPRLDNCLAPEDNTDLNASIIAHGLLPKLSNVISEFLNGVGDWINIFTAVFNNVVAETTTTRTLSLTDSNSHIRCTNAGTTIIVFPLNTSEALPIGFGCEIEQASTGIVTFIGEGGATIVSKDHKISSNGQWGSVYVKKIAADEWRIVGDLA